MNLTKIYWLKGLQPKNKGHTRIQQNQNNNSISNFNIIYYHYCFRFGRIRSIVTTQDLKAGQEIFCQYAGTVDSSTFVRQIFKDFSNFMDLEDDSSRLNYLSDMKEDYSSMLASLNHEPDKIYRKPSV